MKMKTKIEVKTFFCVIYGEKGPPRQRSISATIPKKLSPIAGLKNQLQKNQLSSSDIPVHDCSSSLWNGLLSQNEKKILTTRTFIRSIARPSE